MSCAILAISPPVTLENSVTGGKKEENSLTWVFLDPIQNSVAAKIA